MTIFIIIFTVIFIIILFYFILINFQKIKIFLKKNFQKIFIFLFFLIFFVYFLKLKNKKNLITIFKKEEKCIPCQSNNCHQSFIKMIELQLNELNQALKKNIKIKDSFFDDNYFFEKYHFLILSNNYYQLNSNDLSNLTLEELIEIIQNLEILLTKLQDLILYYLELKRYYEKLILDNNFDTIQLQKIEQDFIIDINNIFQELN